MLSLYAITLYCYLKVFSYSNNPFGVLMCVRAGPGLCLGPVSPSVPGPGPGYHTLIPPNSDKTEAVSRCDSHVVSHDETVPNVGARLELALLVPRGGTPDQLEL